VEELLRRLSTVNPLWVYFSVAGFAFLENIFPPLPSDALVLFVGSLVGLGHVDFTVALIFTALGSTAGFVVMYKVGDWFGLKILETGKIPFIPVDKVHKVEGWFRKYGYFLIVVNRFLTGTRAVVSFFAGMSELPLTATTILSFASALIWNFLLLFAGKELGENWQKIGSSLATYSQGITLVLLAVALLVVIRLLYLKSKPVNGSKK
jgi:membrane protein DedA with SNARE-associated domain